MKGKKITLDQYRAAAKGRWNDEGLIEVDDKAPVSRSEDGGAYVQAWVWVDYEEARS